MAHSNVVVLKRDQREGQALHVPSLGQLLSDQVCELVDWLVGSHGIVLWEDTFDVVEAVANTNVLDDVARMENVSPRWRDLNFDRGLVLRCSLHDETHLFSTRFHFLNIEFEPQDPVDVLKLHIEVEVAHGGSQLVFGGVCLVIDLDLLDLVLPLALAVLTELGSNHSQANLSLLDVGASDLDENVASVECDLCLIRVDDRRQGQNLSVLVVEDGVLVEWLKNWQELLHFDVILEDGEELVRVHLAVLLQSLENDFARRKRLVSNRSSELVQIMGTHGGKGSSAADVLMKFIL